MKLSKQIINGFISWIDLKDVQEYVKQAKNTRKLKIFTKYALLETNDNSFKKQKIFKIIKNNYVIGNYPY